MPRLLKPDHCRTCVGWQWGCDGYVPASGDGSNGCLVVLEAAGKDEANEGVPTIGRAGGYLWQQLARIGIEREGFKVHNVLSCQPPNNFLAKAPYELEVINHCAPLLDATITEMQETCRRTGKHLTIITLGKIAFKRIMGYAEGHDILKNDYIGYPFWNDRYSCWVMAGDHPSFLQRGKHHLVPVLQFVFQRALEIAEQGLVFDSHDAYDLDPNTVVFHQWVVGYRQALQANPQVLLSYDIETNYKKKNSEEDLAKDEDEDHTILRTSFAYSPTNTVENIVACSVRWNAEYMPGIEELLGAGGAILGWNNQIYDDPKVKEYVKIAGQSIDGMVAWHVLNSSLPKSLGFVTPFYWPTVAMWKHLADSHPALYNVIDSVAALRNYFGIKANLITNKQWHVFERHVLKLNEALNYMSGVGVLRDNEMRQEAETRLSGMLDEIETKMEVAVPQAARALHVYKKTPKNTEGMVQLEKSFPVRYCAVCGLQAPNKAHAKLCPKYLDPVGSVVEVKYCKACGLQKPTKKHAKECYETTIITLQEPLATYRDCFIDETFQVWGKPLEFKVSNKGLQSYQKILRHQAIISRKEKKITFNEDAIVRLIKQYPSDPLYPRILEHREVQKLLSVYIGITEYDKIIVPDNYVLQFGEKFVED